MICNHCTMRIWQGEFGWRTRNGYVCESCRDEIIAASRHINNDPDDSKAQKTLIDRDEGRS